MLYIFQYLQHNSFPFFHLDFPLHSYGSIILFFYRRLLSIAKWWHILVSKVVSSSSKSVHSGCERVINVTMSRTGLGLSAFSSRVSVWFFWYPRHVTGMSAKQSQWASFSWTEYGTQTLPPPPGIIFGRGQVLSALNGPLGNLEQLCRRKCFFGGFEISWWMLPFSAKLQQAFHGFARWSVWNLLCPLVPSGDCPYCAYSGVKETLHSHLVSWEFPIGTTTEGKALAQQQLPHRNKTWGAPCSKESCSCCAGAHPGAPEPPEGEVR